MSECRRTTQQGSPFTFLPWQSEHSELGDRSGHFLTLPLCGLAGLSLHVRQLQEDFARPIDQTILLSVDRVVVHNYEKGAVERECAEEEEMVGSQTTMVATET